MPELTARWRWAGMNSFAVEFDPPIETWIFRDKGAARRFMADYRAIAVGHARELPEQQQAKEAWVGELTSRLCSFAVMSKRKHAFRFWRLRGDKAWMLQDSRLSFEWYRFAFHVTSGRSCCGHRNSKASRRLMRALKVARDRWGGLGGSRSETT